ncbi:MAG: hypothetical protein AAGA18_08655 [Verrucomicrobiota bacterium]
MDPIPLATRLRFIQHPEQCSFYNMAVDEALLRLINEKEKPILRVYGWSDPAVSIGYFQKMDDVPEGRPFVRRFTGGGLVDHTNDYTYSIIVPQQHPIYQMGTSKSYAKIHESISHALVDLGLSAALAEECSTGDSNACFEKPVRYDVMQGESKLAGAAQRRNRLGCLHQGSILVPNLDHGKMNPALLRHLLPLLAQDWEESSLDSQERTKAEKLTQQRYSTYIWNHQR